jgi:hypothetical protein
MLVFVLSATDAALTLVLVERGVTTEANPLMDLLMVHDVRVFVAVKSLVTGVGVVAVVAYSRLLLFGRVSMIRALHAVLAFYVLLVGYEALLLALAR